MLNGEFYRRVILYRAFPYAAEEEYISVRDTEGDEIGMIRDLDELAEASRGCVKAALAKRYFAPKIRTIESMDEKSGHVYWDVITDAGFRRFTVKCGGHPIRRVSATRYRIFDVEGNRFEIDDIHRFPKKFLKTIESLAE